MALRFVSFVGVEPYTDVADRTRVFSGSLWEDVAGYCRAVRDADRILVSGTTATHDSDRTVAPADAGAQTTYILDKIAAALSALDASPHDILRTRMYLRGPEDVEAAARAAVSFPAHRPPIRPFLSAT